MWVAAGRRRTPLAAAGRANIPRFRLRCSHTTPLRQPRRTVRIHRLQHASKRAICAYRLRGCTLTAIFIYTKITRHGGVNKDENLRKAFVEEVCEIRDEYVYQDLGRAFQHWAAVSILGLEGNDVADGLHGSLGNDGGIDYFNRNEETKTFEIIQAKFSEQLDAKVGPDTIRELFDVPKKLTSGASSPNLTFKRNKEVYNEYVGSGYDTKLILVVAGEMTTSVKELVDTKKRSLPSNIDFECLEIKDLLALIGNPVTPACTLHLLEKEGFSGKEDGNRIKCMVGTVPVSEFKRLYDVIGAPVLFSENPRMYLDSPISKDIKKTLESQPWRF